MVGIVRLFLALRTSKSHMARRRPLAAGEPVSVSFQHTLMRISGWGRVVCYTDDPAGLKTDFVQLPDLWAHDASKFDDWEPVDQHDPVTALGLAGTA